MSEIEVLSFCLGNIYKWQCNKKCLVSSGAQKQSHQSVDAEYLVGHGFQMCSE